MQNTNLIYVNARFLTQPLTGVQRYAFECSVQMKKMNPSIHFVSPKNIQQHEWAEQLEVHYVGNNTGHLWEQFDLPIFLNKQKGAILFNPCNTAPIFVKNQLVTIHDISFQRFPENNTLAFRTWYNFLIPTIARNCLHIFTVSETVKSELEQTYSLPSEKISVTFNGLPQSFSNEDFQLLPREKIILTVGSISRRKNIKILADVFIESSLKYEYTLVIIGSQSNVFADEQLPSHEKIIWLNSISDAQLKDYYSRAELFVSLSEYEGFGIPVLEAIYFGCKVLCSNIATYHELFGEYVYFCDSMKTSHLQESLMQLTQQSPPQIDIKNLSEKFSYYKSAQHILFMMSKLITK